MESHAAAAAAVEKGAIAGAPRSPEAARVREGSGQSGKGREENARAAAGKGCVPERERAARSMVGRSIGTGAGGGYASGLGRGAAMASEWFVGAGLVRVGG